MNILRTTLAITALACALFVASCSRDDDEQIFVLEAGLPSSSVFPYDNGLLPGAFSVSNSRKVRFSYGNLQYKASTNEWRLAPNQYDFIGCDNTHISPTNSRWIDLFGWGTTGADSLRPPYAHSLSSADSASVTNPLIQGAGLYDWGIADSLNKINRSSGWFRTLSPSQWNYIFKHRPSAEMKHGMSVIKGVVGIVILPDMWYKPEKCSFVPDTLNTLRPEIVNVYNDDTWQLMENEGAVFLPFAGYRIGIDACGDGIVGYYWTSANPTELDPRCRYYNISKMNSYYDYWFLGCAVRLVHFED